MNFSNKLTFLIFTYNEEARIERVIRNFSGWARILIVDNYSTDKTVEIAMRLGADILLNKNKGWVEDEETVACVKEKIETPWMYWGFADELVDYETLVVMMEAIESDKHQIINVARKNYYYGRFCHDIYSARLNRIFKKDAIDFSGNTIHNFGRPTVPGKDILNLDADKYFVRHFISNDAKKYVATIDRYTDIEAATSKYYGIGGLIARLVKNFMLQYVLNGGYKAGREGFFCVLQMMYYQCLLAMKLHEREYGLGEARIEELNNLEREEILSRLETLSVK